jgi:membrane protein required for colicin V production
VAQIAVLDWICIGALLLSLLVGLWRGLVFELLSLGTWLAAFAVAQWLAPMVSPHLAMLGASGSLRYAAAFVLVFIAAMFAGGLVAVLIKKLVTVSGLAPFDRALGGVFGLVRGLMVLLVMAVIVGLTPLKTGTWWQDSWSAGALGVVLKGLSPLLPAEFAKYLG